jgi:two-component system sensor histidine kinase KdpD
MRAMHANDTTSGMMYLVLVVWFATRVGSRLSFFVAVIAALLFDYYFLDPLYSFVLLGFQQWLAMFAFFISCVIVARVAEQARRQTRQSERRRADVERLYSLSQEMMLHGDAEGLVHDIPNLIERIFALDAVVLYVRDPSLSQGDQFHSSVPGAFSHLRLYLRALSSTWETSSELPDGFVSLNLVFGMKTVGVLAWKPATLGREVATSIAAQVAIALTRSLAIEASTRLEAARASDRLRAALIDSLTHELRTPLTAIRAAATTLIDDGKPLRHNPESAALDDFTRMELASIIDEESARLDTLIGQAIEMAQIDANGIRVELAPVQIRSLLEQALEESRNQLASHPAVIEIEDTADSETPVWLDPHLISRVLRHLLENAAKYSPERSPIVLRCRRAEERLIIEVQDHGPGIDPYDLPLIFEKFYRGKGSARYAKGSGMGLAIVRAILTAHSGSIEAVSTLGQGTTFRFDIPAVEKPSASSAAAEPIPDSSELEFGRPLQDASGRGANRLSKG